MTQPEAVLRKTAGLHLLLGTALYGIVLAPMLFVWYPRPLFAAAGGGRIALGGAIGRTLASLGRTMSSVRFLPLRAAKKDGVVLLDATDGMPFEVLLVEPW